MSNPEKLIAKQKVKIARLDARLKDLQIRLDAEKNTLEHLINSRTPEPTASLNPITSNGGQPFPGSQIVILEKRTLRGKLDFEGEQPPTGGMSFDNLWALYIHTNPKDWNGSWESLRKWLDSKGWVVRAITW